MKSLSGILAFAITVAGCALVLGCGDNSSSASPQEDTLPASSAVVDGLGLSSEGLLLSSASFAPEELSSAEVESSSSAAVPKSLCRISISTKSGYESIAMIWSSASLCLPLENCDTLAVNTGYADCYEGRATVEGCSLGMTAEVVEDCGEEFDRSCETPNGTIYMKGRFNIDCQDVL